LRLEPDLDPEPEKLSKHEAATVELRLTYTTNLTIISI